MRQLILGLLVLTGCGGMKPGESKRNDSLRSTSSTQTDTSSAASNGGNDPNRKGATGCVQAAVQTATATSTSVATSVLASYATTVAPILTRNCVNCHSGQSSPRLDSEALATASMTQIKSAVAGDRMPPGGPLAAVDKQVLAAWSSDGPALALADPTYEAEVKAFVNAACGGCHSGTASPDSRRRPYLNTYELLKASASSALESIQDGEMPPRRATPQLAAKDEATLASWINAGMPQGQPPTPIDSTKEVFYIPTIKGLLDNNCARCHARGATAPDLSTYDAAVAAAERSDSRIQAGTMPPAGALSADLKTAFQKWVAAGAPYDSTGTPPPSTATDVATATNDATGTASEQETDSTTSDGGTSTVAGEDEDAAEATCP